MTQGRQIGRAPWEGVPQADARECAAPVQLAGVEHVVAVLVRRHANANRMHVQDVVQIEKLRDFALKTEAPKQSTGERIGAKFGAVRSVLVGIFRVKPAEVSKVVDAQGRPLGVYHGTKRASFAAFDAQMTGSNNGREFESFYFTNYTLGAQTYSGTRREAQVSDAPELDARSDGEPGNYAVYLSLQRPLEVNYEGQGWDGEVFVEGDTFTSIDELVRFARDTGYDGVIARNVVDEGRHGDGYGWGDATFVAFEPSQIKSVHNAGTFDPSDANILRSRLAMRSAEANVRRGRQAMQQALADRADVNRAMLRTGLG